MCTHAHKCTDALAGAYITPGKYFKIYPSILKHKFTQKKPAMYTQLGHSEVLPSCASVSLVIQIQVPVQSSHLIVFAKKKKFPRRRAMFLFENACLMVSPHN